MFQKQPMMRKVLYALTPISLFSVWLYGPRVILVLAVSLAGGILTEYLFERRKKPGKVSEAVLVTACLFALSMPPAVPLWVVLVGIVFAVFMAKEVYGGFGRNIFNPAIAGRLFVYISFAGLLTASFYQPGNFGQAAGSWFGQADALTSATPLAVLRDGGSVSWLDLLIGTRSGAIGESSVILILLAAIYLIATKTAQWRLMLSTLLGGFGLSAIFYYGGLASALPPQALLAGSFLYVTVFMSTDPVSAPKKPLAQWVYGLIIGSVVALIRSFSGSFPEGTSFAVLFGNAFASLLDKMVTDYTKRKKLAAAAGSASPAQGGAQ